ncbi:MAG: type IVB secretion system protein IcmH/DotU [Chitinispirillaceae bacterium]
MVSTDDSKVSQCSIVDFCNDIFMFVVKVRETENVGDPVLLRRTVCCYLNDFVSNCRCAGVNSDTIGNALYALVALVDETVMSTAGAYRDFWSSKLLQIEYFGENLAGTKFFSRLRSAMARAREKSDLLEVYFLCLALGFKGIYRIGKESERMVLFEELGVLLRKLKRRTSGFISPGKLLSECVVSGKKRFSPVLFAAGIGLFLFVVACLTMQLRYSAVLSDVLSLVNAL